MSAPDQNALVSTWMRFRGERRSVVACQGTDFAEIASAAEARGAEEGAVVVYGFPDVHAVPAIEALGWKSLGSVPTLVRPLRLSYANTHLPRLSLLAPFGRRPRAGVREITSLPVDVRITRLWDRFSVDVGFALERNTKFFGWRIHERAGTPYRIFIFEDGDRYAIRAMCIFTVKQEGGKSIGYVMELLHDRSVTGMRAASHLLGLALREMSDAGAESARALALPHSGSYPIFALHAFFSAPEPGRAGRELAVRALDPEVGDAVLQRNRWYVSYVDAMEV
jgi:hypothetical protein